MQGMSIDMNFPTLLLHYHSPLNRIDTIHTSVMNQQSLGLSL